MSHYSRYQVRSFQSASPDGAYFHDVWKNPGKDFPNSRYIGTRAQRQQQKCHPLGKKGRSTDLSLRSRRGKKCPSEGKKNMGLSLSEASLRRLFSLCENEVRKEAGFSHRWGWQNEELQRRTRRRSRRKRDAQDSKSHTGWWNIELFFKKKQQKQKRQKHRD